MAQSKPKKKMGRPVSADGEFKEVRSVRIPDPLWEEVKKHCGPRGSGEFIREAVATKVRQARMSKAG